MTVNGSGCGERSSFAAFLMTTDMLIQPQAGRMLEGFFNQAAVLLGTDIEVPHLVLLGQLVSIIYADRAASRQVILVPQDDADNLLRSVYLLQQFREGGLQGEEGLLTADVKDADNDGHVVGPDLANQVRVHRLA